MKKKIIIKLTILIFFITAGFFGFGFLNKSLLADECKTYINFDAKPNPVRFNTPITFQGYVTFYGTTFNPPGTTDAGYCTAPYSAPRDIRTVKKFTVSISIYKGSLNRIDRLDQEFQVKPASSERYTFSFQWTPSDKGLKAGENISTIAIAYPGSPSSPASGHIENLINSSTISINLSQGVYQAYACIANDGRYACSPGGLVDCSDAINPSTREKVCAGKKCEIISDSQKCGSLAPATISIAPAKQAYKLGETINIAFTNVPNGWAGKVKINTTKEIPISASPYALQITKENGFNEEGQNTLAFQAFNSSGSSLTLNPNSISITTSKTGSAATPGATPGSTATNLANCTGPDPDPSRCLYNPLPEDELTTMFLLIIKGFLMIVGIWAVMFIIVGGFRMVMAAGNEEQYIAAKKTITWAVLGVIVAAMSFSLVAIVQNLLQAEPRPLPFEQMQKKFAKDFKWNQEA